MKEILDYLQKSIDGEAEICIWDAKKCINLQLAGSYDYYLVTILEKKFLLIKPKEDLTIPKMKIHLERIKEKTGYEVAILVNTPTAYKIKKMLEERVAFLTIDKQMFLPFLALHIKQNRPSAIEIEERDKFTAATQMVFLFVLYAEQDEFDTEELAKKLNLSAMTILRAMNELKRIGIMRQELAGRTGRKKIYCPIDRKEYYHIGRKYLINPVKKSFYVNQIPDGVKIYRAGLTALAEQTMLGEPENEVFAVCVKPSVMNTYRVTKAQALLEGMPEIQFMLYDIGRLTDGKYVDPITLIMSISKMDDRTEIAIDELMEGILWYEE